MVAFLKQAGCDAEALNLKDKGILGNGHFMMLESNRKQVFEAIRGWLETKVTAESVAFSAVKERSDDIYRKSVVFSPFRPGSEAAAC